MEEASIEPIIGGVYPALVEDKGLEVVLPPWVNDLLYDELGAQYSPAGKTRSFDCNLDATESEIRVYLGTYFPRSLAESFCIFDSLLSDKKYASALSSEPVLRICSVGTGTGGDLLGLVLALSRRLAAGFRLDIVSIEGNKLSHKKAQTILNKAMALLAINASLTFVNYTFEAPAPFSKKDSFLPADSNLFHFVLTSKMLNELDGCGVSSRPYFEFCEAFAENLDPKGVLMVLDITSPNGNGGRWTPKALNREINSFLEIRNEYKTVFPLVCNKIGEECKEACYTQKQIIVKGRRTTNICSKICYRVIAAENLAEQLSYSPALWNCPITRDNESQCILISQHG